MGMRYNKPVQNKPRPDRQTEIQRLAYEQKADQRLAKKPPKSRKPPSKR